LLGEKLGEAASLGAVERDEVSHEPAHVAAADMPEGDDVPF